MATAEVGRLTVIILLLYAKVSCAAAAYEVPDVTIEVLKPKGFKASIPADPQVTLFVFQGNLNRAIGRTDVGCISGEVLHPQSGRWTYENLEQELKVGDVINYYVVVTTNKAGYIKDNLHFTVTDTPPEPTKSSNETCTPSITKLRDGSQVCAGKIIFEDHFDTFRNESWQIEHYIPIYSTDYPFVSYQRLADNPTVFVDNGSLYIIPKLQQHLPGFTQESIYSETLNLFDGCTSIANECVKEAWGSNILPPVVSGRVTLKPIAFTYGVVYIRAKLPQGDWLYPEILLEPLLKKYGTNHHSSGVIKIASARGNRILSSLDRDFSNKVLYGGVVMDFQCNNQLLHNKILSGDKMWGDDFHLYELRWTPDRITLSVDGVRWAQIEPATDGLRGRFPPSCKQIPRSMLGTGTKMAPFDDHFYLTLGVAAGSVTEFPDGITSEDDQPKPWTNPSSKALLKFWQAQSIWYPTWDSPELVVDYVKIVAL